MKYMKSFNHPFFSWLMALGWLMLAIIVLLKPGKVVLSHELTLSSFISTFFSFSMTRSDLSEALGHIFLFAILTVLWQRVFIIYFNRSSTLLLTISAVLAFAIGTEIGQYFVNRGSMLLDLIANFLGIILPLYLIKYKGVYK